MIIEKHKNQKQNFLTEIKWQSAKVYTVCNSKLVFFVYLGLDRLMALKRKTDIVLKATTILSEYLKKRVSHL